jgi:hypothetical protein
VKEEEEQEANREKVRTKENHFLTEDREQGIG